MIEMKQPMDEVLFHFISEIGYDIDGLNLFTINFGGVHFKQSVRRNIDCNEDLDLDEEKGRTLKIVGVDLCDF
jgi:hypothetical protein